jgi:hypothetical protein
MARLFYIAHRDLLRPIGQMRHASAPAGSSEQFPDPSREYEVQTLDEAGRSATTLFFSSHELRAVGSTKDVPKAVIDALARLPAGSAIQVDEAGNEVVGF